ncbi:MAG: hypothetical protein QE263_05140 [Vampirovibrionales bacterium]|nr:hypothetical protein [Vampirovibrionales bacterium]
MVSININQGYGQQYGQQYNPYAQQGYGQGYGMGGGDLYNMSAPAYYGVNLGSLGITGGYGTLFDQQIGGVMGSGMPQGGMMGGYGGYGQSGYGMDPYGGYGGYGQGGYGMDPYGGYGGYDPYGGQGGGQGYDPYGGDPYGGDPYGGGGAPPPETFDPREKREKYKATGGGHYVKDFAEVAIKDDTGNDLYTIDSHQSKYTINSGAGKNTYTLFGLANLVTIKNFGKDDTLAVTDPAALVVLDEKKTPEGWAMVILDEATGNRIMVNTKDNKHDPDFLLNRVVQA